MFKIKYNKITVIKITLMTLVTFLTELVGLLKYNLCIFQFFQPRP